MNNNNNIQVYSSGVSKVMTEHNGQRHSKELDWEQEYDGKKADIHLNVNQDGHQIHRDFTVRNPDLDRLLSTPAVTKRLETRLLEDFLTNSNNDKLINNKSMKNKSIKNKMMKNNKNNKNKKIKKMLTKKRKLKPRQRVKSQKK